MKKLGSTIMVIAALLGSVGAFASNHNARFAGAFYYNQAVQQPWTIAGAGDPAPDQTATHYSSTTGKTFVCTSSTNVCTYDLIGGEFVLSTEGTNSL